MIALDTYAIRKRGTGMASFVMRRRGSTYVLVLGATMLVTVIGLSSILAIRVQRRTTEGTRDMLQARLNAKSAIEHGFFWIREDPNWRQTRGQGPWAVDAPMGEGTATLEVVFEDDGDTDPNNNPALLTGTGVVGPARQMIEVRIVPVNGGFVVPPNGWNQVVN